MKKLVLLALLVSVQAAQCVNLKLQDSGHIDIGNLAMLLPMDVQLAILEFESEQNFCIGVQALHSIDDEAVESNWFSQCWVAGEFNLVFKLEPVDEKKSWLRIGLNALAGGGAISGDTINVGSSFGASTIVPTNAKLSSNLSEILKWKITVREGNELKDHTIEISAFITENPNRVMGSGHGEFDWPD